MAAIFLAGATVILLASCTSQIAVPEQQKDGARLADLAKCEKRFAPVVADAGKTAVVCACLIDGLVEEGVDTSDLARANRTAVMQTARACAQYNGVPLPDDLPGT